MTKHGKKIIFALFAAVFVLAVSVAALAACGEGSGTHEHAIYPVEGREATCVEEGVKDCDQCIYCEQYFIDGQPVEASEVIIPIDPNNHADYVEHEAVEPTCVEPGNKAYEYCSACEKYYLEGKEVTAEELAAQVTIPATGEHSFNSRNYCTTCDGYRMTYDTGKTVVVDKTNKFDFVATSRGGVHTSADKQTWYDTLIAEKMTFAAQISGGDYTQVSGTGTESLSFTGLDAEAIRNSFLRFAPGIDGEAYVGRFILTFDVSVSSAATVDRLGAKIVDNTATEIKTTEGDETTPAITASQDPLHGADEGNKEGGNAIPCELTPGTKYRFTYSMETTAADQLVQLWICFGYQTTLTVSDLHFIPLPDEEKTGTVITDELSFGVAYTGAKTVNTVDGKDFFDAYQWETFGKSPSVRDEAIYNDDGYLVFTEDTASRFTLFNTVEKVAGSYTHLGDNGKNITEMAQAMYNKEYKYTFKLNATGEFDLMTLGVTGSTAPRSADQAGLYINFAEDGTITLYHTCGAQTKRSLGEYSAASTFVPGQDTTVEITFNRVDIGTLTFKLLVNGSPVVFAGTTAQPDYFSADDAGVFKTTGVLTDTGLGGRVGFAPMDDTVVTVTDLAIVYPS